MDSLVAELAGLLGEANVLVSAQEQAPFLADWLGENRLGWAADLIADLTNVTPQIDPEARP